MSISELVHVWPEKVLIRASGNTHVFAIGMEASLEVFCKILFKSLSG